MDQETKDGEKTPRKTNSMQDKLSFLFGSPLETFDPSVKPSQHNIVCKWIFEYDKLRGSNLHLKKPQKDHLIEILANEVISVWKLQSLEVLPIENVKRKLRPVIAIAEKYTRNGSYSNKKNDHEWIRNERKPFGAIFDISAESLTPRIGKKRKSEEMVSDVMIQFVRQAFKTGFFSTLIFLCKLTN